MSEIYKNKRKMKIVYITGGIATGKTTVLQILKNFGFYTISADEIAHHVIRKGTEEWRKIVDFFGEDILDEKGEIVRKKLGDIVFSDREKLRFLESVIHPKVLEIMSEEIRIACEKAELLAIEIPLIFEKGLNLRPVIVVYTNREEQIRRIMQRDGVTKEEALKRISNQLPIEEKIKMADFVIDNSGPIEKTIKEVEKIVKMIKEMKNEENKLY